MRRCLLYATFWPTQLDLNKACVPDLTSSGTVDQMGQGGGAWRSARGVTPNHLRTVRLKLDVSA